MKTLLDNTVGFDKSETEVVKDATDTTRTRIVRRYQRELGLTEHEANVLYTNVVQFLDVANVTDSVPSKKVDKGWHEFVMHTRLYADFCRNRYGRFVHHNPDDGSKSKTEYRQGFLATKKLMRERYGELSANWGANADCDASGCATCGSSGDDAT